MPSCCKIREGKATSLVYHVITVTRHSARFRLALHDICVLQKNEQQLTGGRLRLGAENWLDWREELREYVRKMFLESNGFWF